MPTKRVAAQCVLLELALRHALDYGFGRQPIPENFVNQAIHESRQLRREIRKYVARSA